MASPDKEPQIQLHGVTKRFGERAILADADLSVAEGEFLVVVGRSGSGKSTLLKIIGGLDRPDRGAIRHDGRDLAVMSERDLARFRRQSLGFVFQFFNLIPTLTVAENVQLPLALNDYDYPRQVERIDGLFAELDLDLKDCGDRFPDELSGGEQQRVAIARALAHEPALVIADEPTGNLDLETATRVLERLAASCRQRGTTLIMATHSREVAGRADRTLTIRQGHLEATEP